MERGGRDDVGLQAQTQAPPHQSHFDAFDDNVLEEVLQYAHENDLIRDHRLSSFSLSHLFGELPQSTIPTVKEHGFTDCSRLVDLELPNPTPRGERLTITDSALALVCEARRGLTEEEAKSLTHEVYDAPNANTRGMKLELPILRTDNDWDVRDFRGEQSGRQDIDNSDHRIPFDPVDVEAGDGLELAVKARLETEAFLRKMEGEKLKVPRESTKYLAVILRAELTQEDRRRLVLEEVRDYHYEKSTALEKLELPISPKLGEAYFIPPAEASLVPIPSDPSSSIFSDDLKAAEARLFEDMGKSDELTPLVLDKFLEDSSPHMDIDALLEPAREHHSNHKIELPLLPNLSPPKPAPSGLDTFRAFLTEELDIDKELEDAVFKDLPDNTLADQLDGVADRAMRSIEQEQLQAADAIARVPVPVMDFSMSEPEWTRLRNSAPAIFKWIQGGNEGIFNLLKWPRNMLVESKLIWRPLSSGANTDPTKEKMEASEALIQSFIGSLDEKDIPGSSDFVQGRDRLIVLEKYDEEEDIEPLLTKTKHDTDLADLVKRRALDTVDSTSKRQRVAANQASASQESGEHPTQKALTGKSKDNGMREKQTLLLGDSPDASARLLDNFMELRGPKKWRVSKYFSSKDEVPALPSPPEPSERNHGSEKNQRRVEPEATLHSKPVSRAPCPPINSPPAPLTVFISLSIPRHLIWALEKLVPKLTLVERDYRAHNTSVWSPGSVCRREVFPPLAYDADVTVSPTTGLIVTSMILVRQKPRPGSSKSSLQERIQKVSLRYERVIILIGGGGGEDDSLRAIAASDSAALAELQGFVSGLECNVIVHHVGGGDDTMSRWVASLLCRYAQVGYPQAQEGLLEAETFWELFLRRAGFNVYAAQAVAGQLKVPNSGDDTSMSSSHHGLAAFVKMTRAERRDRFGQLAGLRVLERVSQAVDEIWNKG